jgi:hypothetical protein
MTKTLEAAKAYIDAGVSVIPLECDGSKKPKKYFAWNPYRERFATDMELTSWFAREHGIGLVCGIQSGGLEVLDFDQPEVFEPWKSLIDASLLEHLVCVQTGSGAYQVLYRCSEITGNTKIAEWEKPDCWSHMTAGTRHGCNGLPVKSTLIETRGEGGYIVGVGSPANVHASGNPYRQISGPTLPAIPTITPAERTQLWIAADQFNLAKRESEKIETAVKQIKKGVYAAKQALRRVGDLPPWDDFDQRGSWHDILQPHGWQEVMPKKWKRPGKDEAGHSANISTNADGEEILTVWSTDAKAILKTGSYGKFRAFTALNFAGDGREAARELRRLGYGGEPDTSNIDEFLIQLQSIKQEQAV